MILKTSSNGSNMNPINIFAHFFSVEHHEDLAKLLTSEQGKPLAEAKGEIGYSNGFLEWFAEEARRINGEVSDVIVIVVYF